MRPMTMAYRSVPVCISIPFRLEPITTWKKWCCWN